MSRNSGFLSSSDRDLGVAFKLHLGSQASSCGKRKNYALLSICDGYLLEPIEWLKGNQASCGVLREDSGLLSRPSKKEGLHLAMTGESRGFFRAAVRCVGFLSSYDGELKEPLVWPQGSPVSFRVARGSAVLLSSHSRGIGSEDALKGESRGHSRVVAENPGFPRLVTETSGSFSGCLWEVRNTVDLGGASQTPLGLVQ